MRGVCLVRMPGEGSVCLMRMPGEGVLGAVFSQDVRYLDYSHLAPLVLGCLCSS